MPTFEMITKQKSTHVDMKLDNKQQLMGEPSTVGPRAFQDRPAGLSPFFCPHLNHHITEPLMWTELQMLDRVTEQNNNVLLLGLFSLCTFGSLDILYPLLIESERASVPTNYTTI